MRSRPRPRRKGPAVSNKKKHDQADETTPDERPAETGEDAPAEASPGMTEPAGDAGAPVVPAAAAAAVVDQVDVTAISQLLDSPNRAELVGFLAGLMTRLRAVEGLLQQYRGESVATAGAVSDLAKVAGEHADQLDYLAGHLGGPETALAAPAPALLATAPETPHVRPAIFGDAGMAIGGIAGRRRQGGARTFTPTQPIEEAAPPSRALAFPPFNPAAHTVPRALPETPTPVRPDAVVLGEMAIDAGQLGEGEHEMMLAGQPVTVRVRRAGARTRGRVFTPPGSTEGES